MTKPLSESELEIAMKTDPIKFIDAYCAHLFYTSKMNKPIYTANHRAIFERWLAGYATEVMAKGSTEFVNRHAFAINEAERRGRLLALSALPMRQSKFRRVLDTGKVRSLIRELKGEPLT